MELEETVSGTLRESFLEGMLGPQLYTIFVEKVPKGWSKD